jgi:hypothetical protein
VRLIGGDEASAEQPLLLPKTQKEHTKAESVCETEIWGLSTIACEELKAYISFKPIGISFHMATGSAFCLSTKEA